MRRGWWGRLKVWLSNMQALHGIVVDLERQRGEMRKAHAEEVAGYEQRITELAADLDVSRREAISLDQLNGHRIADLHRERQFGNRLAHRLRRAEEFADTLPPDLADGLRAAIRPTMPDQELFYAHR